MGRPSTSLFLLSVDFLGNGEQCHWWCYILLLLQHERVQGRGNTGERRKKRKSGMGNDGGAGGRSFVRK
ncbi:hypothetical protein D8674_017463 [Pyrus ussuriensis x Pyrus communis]|uniref:Uncharacterized protein n=1 Tax=Pyrus ussuriensis x Pyrus communis TaxID=2448454 RepID=A0A5N5HGS6_9ROSA|nr:hypothetical protein D8674_017463 [Pyrus ussuriensis x Pyrus communis]